LFTAIDYYNNSHQKQIENNVFLTDDGSTDGTTATVKRVFKDKDIKIINGNGALYWAGGMRLAWCEALKDNNAWDFYLLLNNDTFLVQNAFEQLLSTHHFATSVYNKAGVYSGITSSSDKKTITYGAKKHRSGFGRKTYVMEPTGEPQECMLINANILLVDSDVVNKIGILDRKYQHSCADWAFGIEARKAGFPVLVTGNICGICDNDHTDDEEIQKLISMSFKERISYFSSPVHSMNDTIRYMKKYKPIKVPFVILAKFLKICSPAIYKIIDIKR
jgi:GT2 family glycosyltransferase